MSLNNLNSFKLSSNLLLWKYLFSLFFSLSSPSPKLIICINYSPIVLSSFNPISPLKSTGIPTTFILSLRCIPPLLLTFWTSFLLAVFLLSILTNNIWLLLSTRTSSSTFLCSSLPMMLLYALLSVYYWFLVTIWSREYSPDSFLWNHIP